MKTRLPSSAGLRKTRRPGNESARRILRGRRATRRGVRGRATYALVRTTERDIYQVKVGNYIGQNFGVIIGITDNEIRLKELVQDGTGDWTERSSTLQLADATDQRQERKR